MHFFRMVAASSSRPCSSIGRHAIGDAQSADGQSTEQQLLSSQLASGLSFNELTALSKLTTEQRVEQSARRYRILAYNTFHDDRQQYDQHRIALWRALGTWRATGCRDDHSEVLLGWLRQATQSLKSNPSAPMPVAPRFDTTISRQPAPVAKPPVAKPPVQAAEPPAPKQPAPLAVQPPARIAPKPAPQQQAAKQPSPIVPPTPAPVAKPPAPKTTGAAGGATARENRAEACSTTTGGQAAEPDSSAHARARCETAGAKTTGAAGGATARENRAEACSTTAGGQAAEPDSSAHAPRPLRNGLLRNGLFKQSNGRRRGRSHNCPLRRLLPHQRRKTARPADAMAGNHPQAFQDTASVQTRHHPAANTARSG